MKYLLVALLLRSYASSGEVPLILQVSGEFGSIVGSESRNLPASFPRSTEESSDIEDNFPEDEQFVEVSHISILPALDASHFYYLNNPPLPGSLSPPFSPPEVKII